MNSAGVSAVAPCDSVVHKIHVSHINPKAVAKLALKGVTTGDDRAINDLLKRFVEDGHYPKVDPKVTSQNTGAERARFRQQFIAHMELEKPVPEKYVRLLPPDEGAGTQPSRDRRPRGKSSGKGRQ